jgi:hypothetical protein
LFHIFLKILSEIQFLKLPKFAKTAKPNSSHLEKRKIRFSMETKTYPKLKNATSRYNCAFISGRQFVICT